MEAEVRAILTESVRRSGDDRPNLAQAVRQQLGVTDLRIPSRTDLPRAAELP